MELRLKMISYVILACKKSRPRNHSWGSRPVTQYQNLVELHYHCHHKHHNNHQYHHFHLDWLPPPPITKMTPPNCPPLPDLVERSCCQPPREPWCRPQASPGHSRGRSETGGGKKVEIENVISMIRQMGQNLVLNLLRSCHWSPTSLHSIYLKYSFYRTRVRSLAMLVTNSLTNWLTHSLTAV